MCMCLLYMIGLFQESESCLIWVLCNVRVICGFIVKPQGKISLKSEEQIYRINTEMNKQTDPTTPSRVNFMHLTI
jgi:hypothetical protein